MPFDGLRVLSLESRRAAEIEKLIRNQGGAPFVAPSMREVPLEQNAEAFAFTERLLAGDFDMVILLTAVGTRFLNQIIETRWPAGTLADALRRVTVVVRGPKPAAVMREWNVPVAVAVPEPNTWHEVLTATVGRSEKRIAVQEYGRRSQELIDGLTARGASVTPVPIYQWELPEDRAPLHAAIRRLAAREFDVVLFTTSVQAIHLLQVAAELGLESEARSALGRTVIASIGPTTSETLAELGIPADFEPSHPKMGFLVNEAAREAPAILARKAIQMSDKPSDEKPPAPKDNFVFNAARYTSIATSLPAGVLAGYFIGYALDAWLHTSYLKIVFLILGIVAGFWELIRLLMRDLRK